MKFEWISESSSSTDRPRRIKQWVDPFNVLVLATNTRTVCIMIKWSRLTRFLVLWDLPLECWWSSHKGKNSLSTLRQARHRSMKEGQDFSSSTWAMHTCLLMHNVSWLQLHAVQPSKQWIKFSTNAQFPFCDYKSRTRNKTSMAGIFTVRAFRCDLSIDMWVDLSQSNSQRVRAVDVKLEKKAKIEPSLKG